MIRKIRRRRAKVRGKAVKHWLYGRQNAGIEHPSDEQIDAIKIGFNMGWRARDDEMIGYVRY